MICFLNGSQNEYIMENNLKIFIIIFLLGIIGVAFFKLIHGGSKINGWQEPEPGSEDETADCR